MEIRDELGRFVKGYKMPSDMKEANAAARCIKADLTMSYLLAYIIGVVLGDGWVTRFKSNYKIGLTANSLVFVESFGEALYNFGLNPCYQYPLHNGRRYHRVSAYSKNLYYFLKNYDMKDLRDMPLAFIPEFIRGFYESDGRDRGYGRGFLFFSTKRELLDIVRELLQRIAMESHYSTNSLTPDKKKTVYRLYVPARFRDTFLGTIKPRIKLHPEKRNY